MVYVYRNMCICILYEGIEIPWAVVIVCLYCDTSGWDIEISTSSTVEFTSRELAVRLGMALHEF